MCNAEIFLLKKNKNCQKESITDWGDNASMIEFQQPVLL